MKTVEVDCQEDSDKRSNDQNPIVENFTTGGLLPHNYKMSHDGRKLVSFGYKGLLFMEAQNPKEQKLLEVLLYRYELIWDPSNRYFAFMTPSPEGENIRVVDTAGGELLPRDIYTVPRPASIVGIEWSPKGKDIYWIEYGSKQYKNFSYLKRIGVNGGKPKTLVESPDYIDFFMPPVTWFQSGQGPSSKPYWIVYGTKKGLFLIHRDGRKRRVLTQAPAVGVNNLEWSPDGNSLVINFKRSFRSMKYGWLKGVMIAHLNEKDPKKVMESLYDGKDIHTLWFSPDNKYVTWMKEAGCWYRKPEDVGKPGIRIPYPIVEDDQGNKVVISDKPIKGAIWNKDSTRLAITAGNQVWIYNPATKITELYHEFGKALTHFVAEPKWRGNRLILTIFEDTALTGREAPRPETPTDPEFEKKAAVYADKAKFLQAERKRIKDKKEAKAKKEAEARKKKLGAIDKKLEKEEEKARKKKKKSGQ